MSAVDERSDQRLKLLNWARVFEDNPDIVAAHPAFREELEYLRALELEEVSGLGS